MCSSGDMLAEKQTNKRADKQTRSDTILRHPYRRRSNSEGTNENADERDAW